MYIPSGYNANSLFNLMTGNGVEGEISIVFSDGNLSHTLTGDDVMSVTISSMITDDGAFSMGNFAAKEADIVLLSDSLEDVVSVLGRYTNIPITISLQIANGVMIPMGVFYADPSNVISTEGVSCTLTAYDKAYYLVGFYQTTITLWPVTPTALVNDVIAQAGVTLASNPYAGINSTLLSTAFCIDPSVIAQYFAYVTENATDTFTGDGTTTVFTLSHEPLEVASCSVGGVTVTDYSIDENNIIFINAPGLGAAVVVNYTYAIGNKKVYEYEPITCRQALAHVAYLLGSNAVFDRNGNLKFVPFVADSASRTSQMSITPDHYAPLAFSKDSNSKSYLGTLEAQYLYIDEEGNSQEINYLYTSGSSYSNTLKVSTFDISTQATTNIFGAAVLGQNGIDYQGYKVSLLYGFPYLDCGDAFTLTDFNGNTYTGLPIFSITHTYNGTFSSSLSASALKDEDIQVSFSKNYKSKIDQQALNAASANANAKSAQRAADVAWERAGLAYDAAQRAKTSAQEASDAAGRAEVSAGQANVYANSALDQLGVVEDIVGVLDLLQTNGNYEITTDLVPIETKWYFKKYGSGTTSDPYRYEVVISPSSFEYALTADQTVETGKVYYDRTGAGTSEDPYKYVPVEPVGTEDPSDEGWYECTYYELVGIQESIQNYVSSQLAVTDEGLWLKRPDYTHIQTKVLLSPTDGIVLYGPNGQVIGKYGNTAQIGDSGGFNIKITGNRLIFCNGNYELGFWYDGQLFTQHLTSVDKIDLGVSEGQIDPYTGLTGDGKWSWKLHKVAGSTQNNLYLKWMG